MKKLSLIFMVVCLLIVPVVGQALPINLSPLYEGWYKQQDSPCVIGYSCGPNLGVDVTMTPNPIPDVVVDLRSPLYTGTALTDLIAITGLNPLIALDINQNGKAYTDATLLTIDAINVYINGSLAYQLPGLQNLQQTGAGNALSNYATSGLDLTGATSLQFGFSYGSVNPNTDGKELLFLVKAGTPQVPEPMTLLLVGLGLLGLAGVRRGLKI